MDPNVMKKNCLEFEITDLMGKPLHKVSIRGWIG